MESMLILISMAMASGLLGFLIGLGFCLAHLRGLSRGKWPVLTQTWAQYLLPSVVAGLKLGVFEALAKGSMSFEALVLELGVSPRGLDALLVALLEGGFVSLEDGLLSCTARAGLTEEETVRLLGFQEVVQRQFYYMAESVKEGRAIGLARAYGDEFSSLYQARAAIPDLAKYWDPWMDAWNAKLEAKLTLIQEHFKGTSPGTLRILDWCGNNGGNAIRAATLLPSSHVTVLDLPQPCEQAIAAFRRASLSHRLSVLPCDLEDENFTIRQASYDAVYMIHTIREWSPGNVQRFVAMIFSALQPGGILVVDMLHNRRLGEFGAARLGIDHPMFAMYFLTTASHESYVHNYKDFEGMLMLAGFASIHSYHELDASIVVSAIRPIETASPRQPLLG